MATKQVNPDDPGQATIFLTDLLLLRRGLSDFQLASLMEGMQYEWQFGHPPVEESVWRRLARPVNGQQKRELIELISLYDSHPLVEKMRVRREQSLQTRRNKVGGASRRRGVENLEARTIENSEVRQPDSEEDKPNVSNNDTRNDTGKFEASSSSSSTSGNSSSDTCACAREDDLHTHPANQVVFRVFDRLPPIAGQERIAAEVQDYELWARVCQDWLEQYHLGGRGSPPKVVKLLEIYHEQFSKGAEAGNGISTGTRKTSAERSEQVLEQRNYEQFDET